MSNRSPKSKIWLSSPHMGENEQKYVQDAFDTNWIAPLGPHVNAFEDTIAAYLQEDIHVAALTTGTAAIHLGLLLLGVKPGDDVICQSFTFCGSANPITYVGAQPIFIDSEADTWNMSPEWLETALKDRKAKGKRIGAIIPVHLYGMPAQMDKICAIARAYDVPVLEDAAEALGSNINGQMCGTFGDIATLSFNGNKIITTSGGGALVGSKSHAKQARFLATQARDVAPHYQHSTIGFNYRLSNVCAAIGRGQMEVLPERVRQRRSHFEWYQERYGRSPGVSFLSEPAGYFSNRWLTTALIDPKKAGYTREDIRVALENENIESRPLWKPMHLQPIFKDVPFFGDGRAELLFDQGICLPSGSNMTSEDRLRIAQVLDQFLIKESIVE